MGRLLNTKFHDTAEAFKIITDNPLPGDEGWKSNALYMNWITTHAKWLKRSRNRPEKWRDLLHDLLIEHAKKRMK